MSLYHRASRLTITTGSCAAASSFWIYRKDKSQAALRVESSKRRLAEMTAKSIGSQRQYRAS